jgi:hypothetical protein
MSMPQPNRHLWSSAYLKAMASSGWNVSITDNSRSSGAGRSTTYDMNVAIRRFLHLKNAVSILGCSP